VETVFVLVDEPLREAGEALCASARDLGAGAARCWPLTLPDPPLALVPESLLTHVRNADVIVSLFGRLDPWAGSAPLRASIAAFRAARRGRWAFGAHIDGEALERELTADCARVARTVQRIAHEIGGADEVHIATEAGTDLQFRLGGRPVHRETSFLTEQGAFGNLPGGEVYAAPLEWSAEGKLVVDLSLGGIALTGPLTLHFREGRVVEMSGAAAAELQRRLGDDPWARTVGEFGIGGNPFVRTRGIAALDEKALGTVHLALGANRGFGGENTAATHCDCVIGAPRIVLDGRPLLL
jgi:leucyl aminopeptidase (aminopeptidase T)